MVNDKLPEWAVYEIEEWADRVGFTGETTKEREELIDRVCEAVANEWENE